jgi:hypothetical protein
MSWDAWQIYIPKWAPDYWPNDPREVVGGSPPTNDGTWPWWKLPKDQWPYQAPWE